MTFETISAEKDGASLILRLNRPEKKNAINLKMMAEIVDACRAGEADTEVRGIIIWGGEQFFSAGADLVEALQIRTSNESIARSRVWDHLTQTLEMLEKPVIAAVEGFCITGGWELVMACDIVVAATDASFSVTSSKIGTVPGAGGTQRLPRQVGESEALSIIFSAEPIDGQEAYRIGAVNKLVARGATLQTAKAIVSTYAKRAPLSLALSKRAVRLGVQLDLSKGLELEHLLVGNAYSTKDKNEGISAFLEKRSPNFKGE